MRQTSLRWEFLRVTQAGEPVHWRWSVFTAGGSEVMRSAGSFESLAACVEDAEKFGYRASEDEESQPPP